MAVTYFDVTGNYSAFAPGLTLRGDVLFTPVFHVGDVALGTALSPPTGFVPTPVPAQLVGGVLYALDGSTLRLQSNTSDLNLTSPLYYEVSFQRLVATAQHPTLAGITTQSTGVEIGGFSFAAPVDATPVDLIQVAPAPGTTSAKGVGTGWALTDDGTGLFTISGSGLTDDGTGLFLIGA